MSLRFYHRVRVLPGALGQHLAMWSSLSVGVRGAHATVGRWTVGPPMFGQESRHPNWGEALRPMSV